jgi:hypothetical protein
MSEEQSKMVLRHWTVSNVPQVPQVVSLQSVR